MKRLIIAEKPSVAQAIAAVLNIREKKPGYLPAGTVAELTVDGQYVNPDAPLEVVNVPADTPDIQTGVDLPFTPLMWAGVGMTAGALVLIGVYGYRRRKRR